MKKQCTTCRHCLRGFFCPARWYCMMGEQAREVGKNETCEKWCEGHRKIMEV